MSESNTSQLMSLGNTNQIMRLPTNAISNTFRPNTIQPYTIQPDTIRLDTMDLFIKQPLTNIGNNTMWSNMICSFDNKDYIIQMLIIIIFILLFIIIIISIKKNEWLTNNNKTIDYFTKTLSNTQIKMLSNKKNASSKLQNNQ